MLDGDSGKVTDPAIIAKVVALIRGGAVVEVPELGEDAEVASVYRVFDLNGVLLYVGMTGRRNLARVDEHRDEPWWLEAKRITLVHYPNRHAALEAEAFAIQTERPLYNVLYNSGQGAES